MNMNLTNPMNRKNTKECEIYFSNLEKIKENVAAKVKKMEMIPKAQIQKFFEMLFFQKNCEFLV
jgi:hypothetical protein